MSEMIKKDLRERLLRLDEDAGLISDDDARYRLVIAGGSALILGGYILRATHDIDAIHVSAELRGLLEKYDMDCRVQAYMQNFPYNFEDRLVPLAINGRKIDFYALSLEDIVIAKLYSFRDTDQKDIESAAVRDHLDWELLDKLATDENEAPASALNKNRYADFKTQYDAYIGRFRPCGN